MSWTKEEIEILINAYKCQPCLYAAKHTMYRNRHARKQALLEVANVLKAAGKTVSSLDIKSKFNNLRANFMTQHKKYVASRNSIIGEVSFDYNYVISYE